MDKSLKPERLDMDPQAADTTAIFQHWLGCFEAYLSSSTDAVSGEHKLRILNVRVSHRIFILIRDTATYDEVMTLLKGQYVRAVNKVYARHLLTMKRQRPGESLAEFLRGLRVLARNCSCQVLTAVQHTELLIQDANVAGVRSDYIRQHLFKGGTLDLNDTVRLTNSLEVAFQNMDAFAPDHAATSWASWARPSPDPGVSQACAARQPANTRGPSCYFSGQGQHSRQRCPAQNTTCSECGKKGHFAKVCQARPKTSKSRRVVSCLSGPPLLTRILLMQPVESAILFAISDATHHVRLVGAAIFYATCNHRPDQPLSVAHLRHPRPVPAPSTQELHDGRPVQRARDDLLIRLREHGQLLPSR
ncbi:uncharacterized protein LOC119953747 [Scyliorhinus canicula]|uniref:uncharacterized protein LOC119953747 n=1 Tax=Scyliorhinus canicula TaxID=7830 RepID=UPI0018F4D2CD|nr:uncharacterized protein LOC119953747 [Scyliorhinus canicula]